MAISRYLCENGMSEEEEEKVFGGFKWGKTSLDEGLLMKQLMDWQLISKLGTSNRKAPTVYTK